MKGTARSFIIFKDLLFNLTNVTERKKILAKLLKPKESPALIFDLKKPDLYSCRISPVPKAFNKKNRQIVV